MYFFPLNTFIFDILGTKVEKKLFKRHITSCKLFKVNIYIELAKIYINQAVIYWNSARCSNSARVRKHLKATINHTVKKKKTHEISITAYCSMLYQYMCIMPVICSICQRFQIFENCMCRFVHVCICSMFCMFFQISEQTLYFLRVFA